MTLGFSGHPKKYKYFKKMRQMKIYNFSLFLFWNAEFFLLVLLSFCFMFGGSLALILVLPCAIFTQFKLNFQKFLKFARGCLQFSSVTVIESLKSSSCALSNRFCLNFVLKRKISIEICERINKEKSDKINNKQLKIILCYPRSIAAYQMIFIVDRKFVFLMFFSLFSNYVMIETGKVQKLSNNRVE